MVLPGGGTPLSEVRWETCLLGGVWKWCGGLAIEHALTAPYHPQANGAAEAGVRELKHLLKRTSAKGFSLSHLFFELNSCIRAGGKGSPVSVVRGGRTVRTGVPELERQTTGT